MGYRGKKINNSNKLIIIFIFFLVIPSVQGFSLWEWLGFTSSSETEGMIGFERYNDTTHIWNNGTMKQDYYYTGNCNHQLSNLPDEIWEEVTLGLTYGSTANDMMNNYVELHSGDCNRIEQTDNESYVNITVWKSISYLGKTGILAKNSYITLNDNYMKETFYFKSDDEINTDLWFILKRDNIDINNNQKDDFVKVINLDETESYLNLTYADEYNLTIVRDNTQIKSFFNIMDYETGENIFFYANTTTDFKYIINNDNFFTAFKVGTFDEGQSKQLETLWVDATCSCFPTFPNFQIAMYDVPSTANVGEDSDIRTRHIHTGGITCTGQVNQWEDNSSGSFQLIPAISIDLDCSGVVCAQKSAVKGTYYTRNIDWEGAGTYSLRAHLICGDAFAYSEPDEVVVSGGEEDVLTYCGTDYNGTGDWWINTVAICNGTEVPNIGGNIHMNGTLFNLNGSTLNLTIVDIFLYAYSGIIKDFRYEDNS